MIKLHYRLPQTRNEADTAPLVPSAPMCREHADPAEDCACGIPRDVRTIILRSVRTREPPER